MPIGSIVAVYFVIWWITLFAVLPFAVRGGGFGDAAVKGSDPGAPTAVRIGRIALINSLVALVVLALFWGVWVENLLGLSVIEEITRR